MSRFLRILFLLMVTTSGALYAQLRQITGIVKGSDGSPVPGASVLVRGTRNGVSTDGNGAYAISAQTGQALVFSSVGYAPRTVTIGSGSVVNVTLAANANQLTDVVVTALGVTKSKRAIGYSQATVNSAEITKSSPANLFGSLQGKIAGVTISNVSGTPGGSTKVILRGFSNITGANQPLYVIDGVPLDNSRSASSSSYDFGNNANDIDPNNIATMDILRGSAATSLYGSRGSNGVILITTKKGAAGKPTVNLSLATTFTNIAEIYTPQDKFGQGWSGEFYLEENGNWGPRYDGVVRGYGSVVGDDQLKRPFSFIKNNVKDVFTTGYDQLANISVSGGTDVSKYYVAYGNTYSNGYMIGNNDVYKRNNLSLSGSTKFGALSLESSINYVGKNSRLPTIGDNSFYSEILQIPLSIPYKEMVNYKDKFWNYNDFFTPYADNPFYMLNENGAKLKSDRVYGNFNAIFRVNDWLRLQAQQGFDVTNQGAKLWENKYTVAPDSWNAGNNNEGATKANVPGGVTERSYKNYEFDSKVQALFNKRVSDDFNIDGLLGVNFNDRGSRELSTSVVDLAIPGFYQINNSANRPTSYDLEYERRLFGAYGQVTGGYKNYLYLTLTARNDWSSTLPSSNRSYFYPAANVSWVASNMFTNKSSKINLLKFRASAGRTGADADPYNIYNTLSATSVALGFGNIGFPFNGVPGYSVSNALRNAELRPSLTTEYEAGVEMRMFDSRIGFELNLFNRDTKDQILSVPVDPASGYTSKSVNFGRVRTKGLELSVNLVPVRTKDFNWDLTYNFALQRGKVKDLAEGLGQFLIQSAYDAQFVAIKGQPLGVFMAPTVKRNDAGQVIVGATGIPQPSTDYVNYGTSEKKYTMGMNNNFSYKGINLGFSLDYSKGGKFYSGTADLLNFVGAAGNTTYNDRRPWIVPNSVREVVTNGVTTYVENTTPITEANVSTYYYPSQNKTAYDTRILDATFLKLREVTLGYTLPTELSNRLGLQRISINAFGRNLATWLPKSNRTIDPEVSNYGSDLTSQFGEFRVAPPVRAFGLALKVGF